MCRTCSKVVWNHGPELRNLSSVDEMKDAVWATYYRILSSNEEPNHKLCPQGNDSWCGYNEALALNTSYDHIQTLRKPVMEVIKPVYEDLKTQTY